MSYNDEDFKKIELSAKLKLDILNLLEQTDLKFKDIALVLNELTSAVIKKM